MCVKCCTLHSAVHTPPVIVNTIGLEFDCELSNYCLINGSVEETERTVEICNHISSQGLSASLCLPLSLCPFTINNNFKHRWNKTNHALQFTIVYISIRVFFVCVLHARINHCWPACLDSDITIVAMHCSLYLFEGCFWPPISPCASSFDLDIWEQSSVTIATLSLA